MLGISGVAAQLAASEEGLSSINLVRSGNQYLYKAGVCFRVSPFSRHSYGCSLRYVIMNSIAMKINITPRNKGVLASR
jgi:hypothetical protein